MIIIGESHKQGGFEMTLEINDKLKRNQKIERVMLYCRVGNENEEKSELKQLEEKLNKNLYKIWLLNKS